MVLERLKEYIDSKGITVAAFERSVGMSNASFGKSLKQGMSIGSDKLEKILSVYTDLSAEWLIRGTGRMTYTPFAADSTHSAAAGSTLYPNSAQVVPTVNDNRSLYRPMPESDNAGDGSPERATSNSPTIATQQANPANDPRITQLEQEMAEIKTLLQNLLSR